MPHPSPPFRALPPRQRGRLRRGSLAARLVPCLYLMMEQLRERLTGHGIPQQESAP